MGGSSSARPIRLARIWKRRSDMDYFAGLDISMDETHVCVLDREGVVVRIDRPVGRTLSEGEYVPRLERVDPDGYGYVARGTLLELEGIDPDRKTFVPRDGDSLGRGADAQSQ